MTKYKVTYTTPFNNVPQTSTIEVSKEGLSEEQTEKMIRNNFIKRTALVSSIVRV